MRKLLLLTCFLLTVGATAQTTDKAIRISATVDKNAPSITLNWETSDNNNSPIYIYRKASGAASWGTAITQLASTATTYTDNSISTGTSYEYRIHKSSTNNPIGYINAGIEVPAIHERGAILVLVDSTFIDSCKNEITNLLEDLRGDGWEVIRRDVSRNSTAQQVKAMIVSTAQSNSNLNALYLLGHIAVPHSGNIVPDGHTNNHVGAWSADTYYGDIDGTWTDNSVSNTSSANSKNHNIPNDGNLDQSVIPSDLDLQVGRVDFYDMPAFGKTEVTMMKSYLNKAHSYKTGALTIVKKAIIDDNFKTYPEAFAANGWRNFSVMVGKDNVSEKDFITTLNTDFHQWAYGCGGGTYTRASGVGNTTDIVGKDLKTIFTMLFGSYFGDWDYTNNFLRAPLCADDPALTCIWAGRPNYYLHHMALGANIGYSVRMSQNNSSHYDPVGIGGRSVHTVLLGDPSLRTDYMKPPSGTIFTASSDGATISWTASTEPGVIGYNLYRADSEFGKYELRAEMVTGTSVEDTAGHDGNYWFMVRAVKIQETPSGTYYNLSLGSDPVNGTVDYKYFPLGVGTIVNTVEDMTLYPNPASNIVNVKAIANKQSRAMIQITDLTGRTLYIKNVTLQQGDNHIQINTGHLSSGNYILQLNTESTNIAKPLVIAE